MSSKFLVFAISLFFALFLVTSFAQAADCTTIYGGGQMQCTPGTPTPTPQPIQPVANSNSQTKGGLPVYDQTNAQTTPNTGPEAIGLISLIPAAATGFFLRRKTK